MSTPAQKPLVSIVTPVYNTAEFLQQCVDSVLAQNYKNWRYLIVDNRSTDGSYEIASRIAEADSRVELVRNETHLSQVQNYNHALRLAAKGCDYVKMVQADDRIFPDCVRLMTAVAEQYSTVGIVSAYRLVGERLSGDGLPVDTNFFSGKDVARQQLLQGDFFFGSPTTVMYKASNIRARHDFFDHGFLHEDTAACYRELETCDFGFVHQVLTFSRIGNRSISGRVRDFSPNSLDKLIVVNTFGPTFLDQAEFDQLLKSVERNYFRFLAKAGLRFREKAFWNYHAKGLATIDRKILCRNFCVATLVELSNLVFNPKKSVRMLSHWVSKRLRSRR